ncbi:MAG: hypothetical protein LQ338_006384 [Usnochroma carphineum]|nr:MAG: hypothetical protein LQ338_006384 [Usnochroma carphineum]
MTDVSSNGLKRPHPEDDLHSNQKRVRSNNGSPAPAPNGTPARGKPDINKIMAEARAKAAAVAAKLQGSKAGGGTASPAPQSPATTPGPAMSSDVRSRIEAMKARVAAATGGKTATPQRTPAPTPVYQPPLYDDGISRARGGLDVGLHPALMGDSTQDSRSSKTKAAPFATTMANRRTESPSSTQASKPGSKQPKKQLDLSGPSVEETRSNPYFDPSLGAKTATLRARGSKQLIFNQKGKYIQQAAALRRQAALEAMKKRIAESSRKAGIDEDLDAEKVFLVSPPPEIEWWDEGLVSGPSYASLDEPGGTKIDTPDSIITHYIQHPVALNPPQELKMPPPRPMHLTPKEQAKIRRQRRMADLKEQQAKVRLGLEPPEPPKVKRSNLMRVLGEEAVKDPTAVEARVNREIADRAHKHETRNEERKLTKEQKHDKLAKQQEKDAAMGIYCTVYKIDSLANPRHRFKVDKNAKDYNLTGLTILHPKLSLVVVEGGAHSIAAYRKLMMQRIDWTENTHPNAAVREGNKEAEAAWLQAEDEKGVLKDLGGNKCQVIWEGEEKQRGFRKWGSKVCGTDAEARDALTRGKMESMWALAKSVK